MVTHSSILDWKIPWAEETGGLQSVGLQSQTPQRLSSPLIDILHLDIVCLFHRKGENNYIKFYRSFQEFLQKDFTLPPTYRSDFMGFVQEHSTSYPESPHIWCNALLLS